MSIKKIFIVLLLFFTLFSSISFGKDSTKINLGVEFSVNVYGIGLLVFTPDFKIELNKHGFLFGPIFEDGSRFIFNDKEGGFRIAYCYSLFKERKTIIPFIHYEALFVWSKYVNNEFGLNIFDNYRSNAHFIGPGIKVNIFKGLHLIQSIGGGINWSFRNSNGFDICRNCRDHNLVYFIRLGAGYNFK